MTYPLERLFRLTKAGPEILPGNSTFSGRTTLASGSAVVTISTAQVNSDSAIFITAQRPTVSSGAVCVRSINPGTAFTVGWTDATARNDDTVIMWELKKMS